MSVSSIGRSFPTQSGNPCPGVLKVGPYQGGHGCISVTANVLPGKVAAICKAVALGDLTKARTLYYEMRDINDILFIDTNPVPVKAAIHLMGKIENEIRAPLVELSNSHLERIKEVLNRYGLLGAK